MFSRQERFFIQNPEKYTKKEKKNFRYRIKKKLLVVSEDLELIIKNGKHVGLDESMLNLLQIPTLSSKPEQVNESKSDKFTKYENDW
jgi:hypothetical protein